MATASSGTPPRSDEELDRAVEVWKTTVGVQQHFNDIEMRIRNYALTLLVGILAGAGVALKDKTIVQVAHHSVSLGSVILLAGLIGWLAFYFMDVAWYHRLLK